MTDLGRRFYLWYDDEALPRRLEDSPASLAIFSEARMAAEIPEPLATLYTLLPGPDRKRSHSPYGYRLTYRNPKATEPGCVMIWEVSGGRMAYQIALERDESGNLRLHCTCADAVFRAEDEGRFCKHVHGLLRVGKEERQGGESLSLGA